MTKPKTLYKCGKFYNSPEQRRKRSEMSRRAARIRWAQNFAARESQPKPPVDLFRLTVENLVTGKNTVILFHPGDRKNNLRIDVDGNHWKTCGMVAAEGLIITSLFAAANRA